MRSSAIASLAALFFAIYTAPVARGQETDINCERSDLDGFEYMHSPQEGFLIYWNHPTESISFRVEVVSEEWAAVGFSEDGNMVGSDAVIFLPEEDDVSEHILGSKSVSDILPSDVTELSDTSFEQEGGDTIFWFTRNTSPKDTTSDKLVIPNIPNQPIYIIWAFGMDNGFGYHGVDSRGSFFVDLFCTELEMPAPTPAAILPTAAPVTASEPPPSFTLPPGGVAETAPPATVAAPTAEPVASPTAAPVAPPTAEPVAAPTAEPVAPPTAEPVTAPAAEPVAPPTADTVAAPTAEPVAPPTAAPVAAPAAEPVAAPTAEPVAAPTAEPVAAPTAEPTAPVAEPTTTTMPIAAPFADEGETTTVPAAAPTASDPEATRNPVESPLTTESPAGADEGLAPRAPTEGGGTPTPTAGSRGGIGVEGEPSTIEPTPNATGYTGGAASWGGGADGATVISAVMAACVAVVWARWD